MSGESKPPRKKRWSWWKTLLLVLVLLVVGLVVARWLWGRHADRVLQAEIDAIRARGEPLAWLELKPEPIPDEENAAELYRKAWAIALLDPKLAEDSEQYTRLKRLGSMVSDLAGYPAFRRQHAEDVRRILALAAESLALCRKARALKQADWKLNFRGPALAMTVPELSPQRELAKLLRLAAIIAHEAGDDASAVEYIRDALAAGRAVGTGPTLIHALFQLFVDAQATRGMEQIAPALRVGGDRGATPEQVRKLIAELLDEKPIRQSMLLALMSQRASNYDTCERFRRGRQVARGDATETTGPGMAFLKAFQPMLKIDQARLLRHMTGYVDAMREKTYRGAMAKMPIYVCPESRLAKFTKMLSNILAPSYRNVPAMCYWQLAARKMAGVALAIRLYEIDTGRRPEKLADLVGKYLPAMPIDPFATDGRPLGYLPKAKKPRLYSINRDDKDDGGEFALAGSGEINRETLDLVFFLNAGDHPLPPCDWYDPTTRPARKWSLPKGPGGRIGVGPIRGPFPPATLPSGR